MNARFTITGFVVQANPQALELGGFLGVFFVLVSLLMFVHQQQLRERFGEGVKNTLAALLIGGTLIAPHTKKGKEIINEIKGKDAIEYKIGHDELKPGEYLTKDLQGNNISGLYTAYIGYKGEIPDKLEIDFNKQMQKMYEKKLSKYSSKTIENFYNNKVKDFDVSKTDKITIDDYISEAQNIIKDVKKNIDWNKIKNLKKLNDSELELLKKVSGSLDGKDLISYATTEIMPGILDGELNVEMMDFLLQNAGRQYVELIPSPDKYLSVGPYQFTSLALFDSNGERRGASKVNLALPENKRIPGSVAKLQGPEHHKAAYLFAINNLSTLIKNLDKNQINVLYRKHKRKKDDIVKFIATSHYAPKYARQAAYRWLDNKANSDFTISCSDRIADYSRKTRTNINALKNFKSKPSINTGSKKFFKISDLEENVYSPEELRFKKSGKDDEFDYFKYTVKPGDTPISISDKFDSWDKAHGDHYKNTGNLNVVNKKHKQKVVRKVHSGDKILIRARRNLPDKSNKK